MKSLFLDLIKFYKNPEFKKVVLNFSHYGGYQVISYLIPIITIPYIVRIVGPERFGIISLAQAVSYYALVIVDYGYTISGVQKISQHQSNFLERSVIVKNIFFIQLCLFLLSSIVLLIGIKSIAYLNQHDKVFIYAFMTVPANILIAIWFYMGIEKVRYINYITIFSRGIYIVLIFLFIRKTDDYIFVPLIYSISQFVAGLYSLFLLIRVFNVKFGKKIVLNTTKYLKNDFHIYISNIFINFYRNSNIIILRFFAGDTAVGIYSAAEKIVKAIQGIFAPITQVLYPFISRVKVKKSESSKKIIKFLIISLGLGTSLISIIILSFSDQITLLVLGQDYALAGNLIKITAFVIVFGVLNYIIGIIFMTNYGMKVQFSHSVIITGILNIVSCSMLSYHFYELGAAIALMLSEFILFLIMLLYIYAYKSRWVGETDG